MQHLRHSPGLILIVLVALFGLAACGSSASAPAATPPSITTPVAGEFVGITNKVDAIGISTNGQQLIAYACDGYAKQKHTPTYAVWFKGAVSHNAADLTATNGSHLVVTLTAQAASGTVTLSSGQSFSFTAIAVPSRGGADLYRSEQTGVLLAVPLLTAQQFAARRETVPNLGIFPMTYCQQGQC